MTGKCKFLVLALLVFDKHFIQSLQSNLYKIIVKLLHYFVHQQVNNSKHMHWCFSPWLWNSIFFGIPYVFNMDRSFVVISLQGVFLYWASLEMFSCPAHFCLWSVHTSYVCTWGSNIQHGVQIFNTCFSSSGKSFKRNQLSALVVTANIRGTPCSSWSRTYSSFLYNSFVFPAYVLPVGGWILFFGFVFCIGS